MKPMKKMLVIAGGGAIAISIYAANCTTDVSAKCHEGSTNSTDTICVSLVSSDAFSTKCISTTNSTGGLTCDSITNQCVWQEWNRVCILGDSPKDNHTNNFDTTTSKGTCGGG